MVTKEQVLDALREVIDPELGLNIVELGLIYGVEMDDGHLSITMTLTTPGCPLSMYLTDMAEVAVRKALPEVATVDIDLVWEPPWDPSRLSEEARNKLGLTEGQVKPPE